MNPHFDRLITDYPSGLFRVQATPDLQLGEDKTVSGIIRSFHNFFLNKGYAFYHSLPLKTDDETLLLMNSTFAMFKNEMLSDTPLGKRAMSQLCFRDKESKDYLYSFNMLGISADIVYLPAVYTDLIAFLEKIRIPLSDLHVVVNAEDHQLVEYTQQVFSSTQIHYLSQNNEKYDVSWKFGHSQLRGKGLTIVGRIQASDQNNDIMGKNFVPLGNIILVDNGYGLKYIDVGFGVECLLSFFYEGTIFSIPFYQNQEQYIQANGFSDAPSLLKNLLAITTLFSESILPGNKKESYIATKIENRIFHILRQSQNQNSDLNRVLEKISPLYSEYEMIILRQTFESLSSRLRQFNQKKVKNTVKAKNLALKLLKSGFSTSTISQRLWTTFGLSNENSKEVIMQTQYPTINLTQTPQTVWSQNDFSNVKEVHFREGIILANQIVSRFLNYFVGQSSPLNHQIIKGASVLTKNDPTLLFINSGMAAIKPYFTGEETPATPRLCNVQPCIRTNDIDDIGDMHHLSFFHMMGSWSIGDYYKKEAVNLAYNLLINTLKFPKEKLYVTVFGGDEKLHIERDDVTANYWRAVGFTDDHIVFLPAEDNFWGPAGDTGPCGPCTEIFYDMGDGFAPAYIPGRGETFDTKRRYVEIWNGGVFMQYFMHADKSLTSLKLKSVDTGSGLERMTMTMNGYDSVYETDLLKPIYDLVDQNFPMLDIHKKRMLTDHFRTAIYLISEGISPGATGREYIVRKLIRKCVAVISATSAEDLSNSQRPLAGLTTTLETTATKKTTTTTLTSIALASSTAVKNDLKSILEKIIPPAIAFLAKNYLHFAGNEKTIETIINLEAEEFLKVIKKGKEWIQKNKPQGSNQFSPKVAHHIVTTIGLPFDILVQTLNDEELKLDTTAYQEFEKQHKLASKGAEKTESNFEFSEQIKEKLKKLSSTNFVGYGEDSVASSQINMLIQNDYLVEEISNSDIFYFVTSETSFYAEGGGQVGDKGIASTHGCQIQVLDTKLVGHVYVHAAKIQTGVLHNAEEILLTVDSEHRLGVKRNHSATHLLHYALCQTIGAKAIQRGSLVDSGKLRFDFNCSHSLSNEQQERIEKTVNELIIKNLPITTSIRSYEEAQKQGAIAMFGEKYQNSVRVVQMGPSMELCGGTHASRTGDLGLFLIESEKSISKGVRRIVALTGPEALKVVMARSKLLQEISSTLGTSSLDEIPARLEQITKQASQFKQEKEISFTQLHTISLADQQELRILKYGEVPEKKHLASIFKKHGSCVATIVFTNTEKGLHLQCVVKDGVKTIDAKKIVTHLIKEHGAKGGGNGQLATCTCTQSEQEVLSILRDFNFLTL